MKTAIILHGMPSKDEYETQEGSTQADKHWMPWLKAELEAAGLVVHAPELPAPYDPDYAAWSAVFEQFEVNEETMLVGHSCGGGFLLRWLSEHKIKVGKVALVAPFLDPEHEAPKMELPALIIDSSMGERAAGLKIFYSTDDMTSIVQSVTRIKEALPFADYQEFSNMGHFTFDDMHTREFPELRDFLLS